MRAIEKTLQRLASDRAKEESEMINGKNQNRRSSVTRVSRGGGLLVMAAVSLFILVGCEGGLLDVDDPDIVTPGQLEGPSSVPSLVAGIVGDFQEGYDEYMLYTTLFTDEMILAGTFPTRIDVDDRNVVQEPGNASLEADIYAEMHVARASADGRVEQFEQVLDDPDFSGVRGDLLDGIALGKYYGAYSRMLFSEAFCQSIFGGEDGESAPLSSTERMMEALGLFQEAEVAAQEANLGSVASAAQLGQARALMWLGSTTGDATLFQEAADSAAQIPTGFLYASEYSGNQPEQNNEVFQLTWGVIQGLRWTVGDGNTGRRRNERWAYFDEWVAQGLIVSEPSGFDSEEIGIPVFLQTLYDEEGTGAVLASGWEARMIEAENMLRDGSPGQIQAAEDMVNALLEDPRVNPMVTLNPDLLSERSIGGVPVPPIGPFDPVDFTGDLEQDLRKLARARAAGLWLSGTRQGTLRRWVEEFGPDSPTNLYPEKPGMDIFFPVVDQELDNNPNISSPC